jgi:DNA polymerase III subunit gamma/tau
MAYEPLHHKYRPQTFKDLVGQEAIATTLIHAIELAKIAPAYLFTGPRGTGKTSSARILAKSLNCLAYNQPTANPCGKCEVCRAIAVGNALDTIEIDAASNTGVDNIRELIERSHFAPVQSRYKVYAIDECHMLTTAAFNALLKTLEEPPPQVVFILATTDPQRVLSTIISRCQRFDYRRIPLEAMVRHLSYIAQQEKIAINLEALTLVAQIANGGLRDAESLLDQLSLFPDTITVERVWDLVGVVPERDLLALLTAIRKQDIEAILAQCRSLLDKGREPLVLLQNLTSFYLNLLIAKTAPSRQDLVSVTETCWQQLVEEAKYWDVAQILQGQQQLKDGEVQIKNTTQPRLWLEVTLLGLLERAISLGNREQQNSLISASKDRQVAKNLTQNNSDTNIITFPNQNVVKEELKSNFSRETSVTAKEEKDTILSFSPQSANDVKQEIYLNTKEPDFTPEFIPVIPVNNEDTITENDNDNENSFSTDSISTEQQVVVWQQVINCIHPPMTQALLRQQCHLISLTDSNAIVGISSAPLLKVNQGKVPNIEAAFAKVCQRKIKVILEVASLPEEGKKNSNLVNNSVQTDSEPIERSRFIPLTPIKTNFETTEKQEILTVSTVIEEDLTKEQDRETELTIEAQPNKELDSVTTSLIENTDNFTKAVELIAKKFDGEIIELQDSVKLSKLESSETSYKTTPKVIKTSPKLSQETTIKQQQVIIKREAISDYDDDDDVPF